MELRPWPEVEAILPMLSTDELTRLERSIRNSGIKTPILAMADGRIIDGHHRWRTARKLGIPPVYEVEDCTDEVGFGLAIALNIDRRQMTAPQIGELQKRLDSREAKKAVASQLREQGSTQAEAAQEVGVAQQTLAGWEANDFSTNTESGISTNSPDYRVKIPITEHPTIYARAQAGETQEQIAADYKVAQKTISNIIAKMRKAEDKAALEAERAAKVDLTSPITLYCADCLDLIPTLPDSSIALVVTDPPYNVTDNEWDKIGTDTDYLDFTYRWLKAIRPKLADNYHLFMFCDPMYQARIESTLLAYDWPLKSRIIWEYRNLPKGRDVADKFISNWQMCFHCGTHSLNWPAKWNEERFEVQQHATPQSNFAEGKHHPTSKPVKLIELLIKVGSNPGDTILDPFAGGGTTGKAVLNVGKRRGILVEKCQPYCTTIENWLQIRQTEGS